MITATLQPLLHGFNQADIFLDSGFSVLLCECLDNSVRLAIDAVPTANQSPSQMYGEVYRGAIDNANDTNVRVSKPNQFISG